MKNLINYLKDPDTRMYIIGAILWVVGMFAIIFALPKDVDAMTKFYFLAGFISIIIGCWFMKKSESIITTMAYLNYKAIEFKIESGETLTDDELSAYNLIKDNKTMQRIDKIIEDNGKEEI